MIYMHVSNLAPETGSQLGTSNCISQLTMGCSYLSLSEIAAHGTNVFIYNTHFVAFCCRLILVDCTHILIASPVLDRPYDCTRANEATLKDMGKCTTPKATDEITQYIPENIVCIIMWCTVLNSNVIVFIDDTLLSYVPQGNLWLSPRVRYKVAVLIDMLAFFSIEALVRRGIAGFFWYLDLFFVRDVSGVRFSTKLLDDVPLIVQTHGLFYAISGKELNTRLLITLRVCFVNTYS